MYAPSASPSSPGSGKVASSLSLKPPLSPSHLPRHLSPYSSFLTPPQTPPRQRTPKIATPTSPAIEPIREMLYAALADVLASTPSLLPLLKSDPPRAYFGAVLAVSTSPSHLASSPSITDNDNVVMGVGGVQLTLADCPVALRPLMGEFSSIRREVAHIDSEEETMEAIRLVQEGREGEVRARLLLERWAGYDVDGVNGRRQNAEGRELTFANRVNALALGMTRLPEFKERQDKVFKVLAGVGFSS